MLKNKFKTDAQIDYIHALYYFVFNGLFLKLLTSLVTSFEHIKTSYYVEQH